MLDTSLLSFKRLDGRKIRQNYQGARNLITVVMKSGRGEDHRHQASCVMIDLNLDILRAPRICNG
jgi:hypothetical protein